MLGTVKWCLYESFIFKSLVHCDLVVMSSSYSLLFNAGLSLFNADDTSQNSLRRQRFLLFRVICLHLKSQLTLTRGKSCEATFYLIPLRTFPICCCLFSPGPVLRMANKYTNGEPPSCICLKPSDQGDLLPKRTLLLLIQSPLLWRLCNDAERFTLEGGRDTRRSIGLPTATKRQYLRPSCTCTVVGSK